MQTPPHARGLHNQPVPTGQSHHERARELIENQLRLKLRILSEEELHNVSRKTGYSYEELKRFIAQGHLELAKCGKLAEYFGTTLLKLGTTGL